MLSPPSSPPRKNNKDDVDVESMTNAVQNWSSVDPSWEPQAHGGLTMLPTNVLSAPHSASSLAEIGGHLQNAIVTTASECSMMTLDCTHVIAQQVASNRITLSELLETEFWLRPATLRRILAELAPRYQSVGMPVPHVPDSDEAIVQIQTQNPFTLFTIQTLRGVAYPYLCLVWRNVDTMVLLTDPRVSDDLLFQFIQRERSFTPHLSRQIVSVNTRWHPRYGYSFWHLPEVGPTRDQSTLFLNPAVLFILHQLLVKSDSGFCITSEEMHQHPHNPTQYVAVHPMHHAMAQKVAFALSWMVVQIRQHGDCYAFDSKLILTPDRIQCVQWEQSIISALFREINLGNDERLEPLSRFFKLIVTPNGQ